MVAVRLARRLHMRRSSCLMGCDYRCVADMGAERYREHKVNTSSALTMMRGNGRIH